MKNEHAQYQFFITADGSPTLELRSNAASTLTEKMHNILGALTETEYVYGRAVDYVLIKDLPPRFCIVGLGLGYIELMIAAKLCLKTQIKDEVHMLSFEADQNLRSYFLNWLEGKTEKLPVEFSQAYLTILKAVSQRYRVPETQIKQCLRSLSDSSRWQLEGLIDEEALSKSFGHINFTSAILFDAFSSKISPELWSEKFLKKFIECYADKKCIFATYAASSKLKQVLKNTGFKLEKLKGLGKKRESTFAIRG